MIFIDLKKQYQRIQDNVLSRINTVLNHGQYIMGPEIVELEHHLAEFVGAKYAIGAASGTDALLMALMALDIQPEDEVITTPFSFIATAEVIALLRAKPVFVDIDPHTYNIVPALIEQAITSKTKAIMPVSLYGQCADFDAINAIAAKYNIAVIEDAAQSFGATYKGKRSCNLSTIGCTSFFPSKPLGGYGDSGACFTNDEALAQKLKQIRNHGQDRRYHHPIVGINGRMDTLQAAILLAKLDIFAEEIELRAQAAHRYNTLLQNVLPTPIIAADNTSVYAQYTVEVDNRDAVQKYMQENDIPTMVHYPLSIHQQPAFAYLNYNARSFPVSECAAQRVMSLPMHPYITAEDQARVVEVLARAIKL